MRKIFSVISTLSLLFIMIVPRITFAGGNSFDARVNVNKSTAAADGSAEITITVFTWVYQCDAGSEKSSTPDVCSIMGYNPTTSHEVAVASVDSLTLNVSGSDNTISPSGTTFATDGTGTRTFTIKSTTAEQKNISITYNGFFNIDKTYWDTDKTVTFTAPTTSTPTTTTTNSTSSSTSSTSSSSATPNAATSTTPPAVPVLESLTVGSTSFAAEKIVENKFKQDEKKIFSGKTIPNGVVHLYFHSDPFEDTATADANGVWSYTLARDIGAGEHELQIAVTDPATNLTSEKSAPVKFALAETVNTKTETKKAAPTIGQKQSYLWYYVGVGVFLLAVLGILTYFFVIKHGIFSRKKRKTETEDIN